MCNIKNWLKEENIHLHLDAESELEAIWTMLKFAEKNPVVTDTRLLAKSIYENEILNTSHIGTTGIIFHAMTDAVINPLMVVGHFDSGIGYYSKGKKPIDIVVLLAAPERLKVQLEDMIICIKDMFNDCDFLEEISSTENPSMVYQYFQDLCLNLSLKKKFKKNENAW